MLASVPAPAVLITKLSLPSAPLAVFTPETDLLSVPFVPPSLVAVLITKLSLPSIVDPPLSPPLSPAASISSEAIESSLTAASISFC